MTQEFLLKALRKRWPTIILITLVGVAGAAGAIARATAQYESSAQLFVSVPVLPNSNLQDLYQGGLLNQQKATSYAALVTNRPVMNSVIRQLHLRTTPEALAGKVTASSPQSSVLINLRVRDSSARRAQQIATATASTLIRFIRRLEAAGQGDQPSVLSVSNPASLSTHSVSPRKKLSLAIGLLVGLVLGLAAALLRESLDKSVRTERDLEEAGAGPLLGVVPAEGKANPIHAISELNSPRAEALRMVRTSVQFLNVDDPLRSIVVTSTVPGEGKSSTSLNLARVLAQGGTKVLLLEADLRAPTLGKYLGLAPNPGLSDILAGRAELGQTVQEWNHVDVIVAGTLPPNPSELLASQRLASLVETLYSEYELIVVDAPPVSILADASVLAAKLDATILVTGFGRSTRHGVRRAVEILHGVNARLLGTVLNMVPGADGEAYNYGYVAQTAADLPNPAPVERSSI
jgi:capsular exopolysaccharide synthesis family protein